MMLSLLAAITKFEFLMAFSVVNNVLGFTKRLTISLQSQAKDICNAYTEVDSVKRVLQDVRSNIDTYHKSRMVMLTIFMRRFMLDLQRFLLPSRKGKYDSQ